MSERDRIEITPLEDGPLLVKNLGRLIASDGTELETGDVIALCRCGASKNKPFCDGTHKETGFRSARESTRDLGRSRDYAGAGITVHDNRALCSHAAECVTRLPQVFRQNEKPWITPDQATTEELIDVIRQCPSGALSYTQSGEATTEFGGDPAVEIVRDGPYNVRGGIRMETAPELGPAAPDHYSLCRCGASKNKPYCDGSHTEAGFKA